MIAAVLALALAAAQAEDPWPEEEEAQEEHPPHVLVTAWGGGAFATTGSSRESSLLGAEAAWAFQTLDLGVAGYAYRHLPDATREWSPVTLVRLTQRFETRRGVEAAFTVGLGAGRTDHWRAWYQLALGVRVGSGPLYLAGEFGFEQLNQVRLAAGLGARF